MKEITNVGDMDRGRMVLVLQNARFIIAGHDVNPLQLELAMLVRYIGKISGSPLAIAS